MSNRSLPFAWMDRPPTEAEKARQDARLQVHLDRGWSSGLFDEWRAQIVFVHDYFKELLAQVARTLNRPQEAGPAVERYVREYRQLVLFLASAGDRRRLIPVDLWPHCPQPLIDTEVTEWVLEGFIDFIRDKLDLYTAERLLANRHYAMLLAHVFVNPARLEVASDIPEPYPWPFVIRVDQEGTPSLDRQDDMTRAQRKLADRIDTALRAWPKQAGRAAYGSLPKDERSATAAKMKTPRGRVAKVVQELLQEDPLATWTAIRTDPRFTRVQEETGVPIVDDSELSRLMKPFMPPGWRKPRGRS